MDNSQPTSSEITSKKPSKRLRFLKRFFIFLLALIILIVGGAMIIVQYYQKEVKEYLIAELNKQLNTEIIVDADNDIDFTVLRNFPYASVDFKNVKALEAIQSKKKDTLFSAGEISFQFNVLDVFKKNYHIKKIEIKNVDLRLRVDKKGNDNFHFWKESTDTSATSLDFSLEKIILSNVHVQMEDLKSDYHVDFIINKNTLSGNFSDEKYSLKTKGNLFVNILKVEQVRYLYQKNLSLALELNVDNSISSYKVNNGEITIESLLFEVFGNIVREEKETILNVGVKGKDLDINSFLSLIPSQYKEKISGYKSEGDFYFDATIKGSISDKQRPKINADFGIKNANIINDGDDINIKAVNLKGTYYSGDKSTKQPSKLSLIPFYATLNEGTIEGELTLIDLEKPAFLGKIKANLDLQSIQKVFKIDTIESIEGKIMLDVTFNGNEENIVLGNYKNISTTGTLKLNDLNLKIKNFPLDFNGINGDYQFDNNDLMVNSFGGKISNSDFQLKGVFKNAVGFILEKNQSIFVDANLNSTMVDLNELLANKEEESNKDSKYKLRFSEYVNLNLNAEINQLAFRKFEAKKLKGVIKLKDKKMMIDSLLLNTMNGKITTTGLIDGSDSTKIMITCFSDIDKINITEMFRQFENFGQTTLEDKNLKGITTAKIQMVSELSPELEMNLDKLYADIDITITNGELNNVEAMKSLSRFIKLKDLNNVRFSTLKNKIEVKNKMISFPKMEVNSSAMNITASGTHSFSNDINYKIKLDLNEILFDKAKKAKSENEEFGEVADDGLGRRYLFLSMTGTVDDPVIKYDTKSAFQNVKQDIKVEKQNIKAILKEEFGLFKKDSTLNSKKTTKETKFTIKWDDAKQEEEKKELKKPKKEEEEDY